MTKKEMMSRIQKAINNYCLDEYNKAVEEFETECRTINGVDTKQLRTCNATVFTTTNYYILRSYNTIVAVINRNTDTLYDVLRIVYGYTATSAQHIAKFNHDYCQGKWECTGRLVAR